MMTLGERPRLLLSASDPAAADAVRPIVLAAGRHGIAYQVVAGEPAYGRLRAAGIDVERFAHARVVGPDQEGTSHLIAGASTLIADYRPDAIIVGLSGPDAGLDEALLMAADGNVPTYAVQDFWGDVNTVMPARPSTFFVVDTYAAQLTRQRVSSDIHVVGPLRYVDYTTLSPGRLRNQVRSDLGLADDRRLVGLFTQALWHVPGYAAQWKALITHLARSADAPVVFVRRHPRDSQTNADTIMAMVAEAGIGSVDASRLSIEESLCACDLVCSAFSSVATDLCYLQQRADAPLGAALLLLFAPDVRRHFEELCRFTTHPLVSAGLVLEAGSADALDTGLAQAFNPLIRKRMWQNCRELPQPANAAELVIERVRSDWARKPS